MKQDITKLICSLIFSLIIWLSEICLTSLKTLFWNLRLLFSHSKNIRMSSLITIIITYYLLIIIIIIITKSLYNYGNVVVMELYLLNLLILIVCFLCNSDPCVLFESLLHVINQESHVYSWNLGKISLVHFLKFWNLPLFTRENFKKANSENLSRISLLNMWLLVQINFCCLRSDF